MANPSTTVDTAVYWRTWAVLLVLTSIMFFLDSLEMPQGPFVAIMLTAMSIKAALIAGVFMHLLKESRDLAISIVVTVIGLGLVLWVLIDVDARRILEMLPA